MDLRRLLFRFLVGEKETATEKEEFPYAEFRLRAVISPRYPITITPIGAGNEQAVDARSVWVVWLNGKLK